MKKTLILMIVLFPMWVFSQNLIQWNEDFSDGDFTKNPVWSGMTGSFIVNSEQQLQSNVPTASTSYLSTPSEVFDDATWEFWVKINYNPTSSNYSMVYIISDRANVSGDVNGYYVQIGNTGKEISLYRQKGTKRDKIIAGTPSILNAASVEAKVKVTRTKNGEFSLFRKLPTDADWVQEGGVVKNTEILGSKYFSLLFVNSNATGKAYFFDDISVSGEKLEDLVAPVWTALQLVQPNQLILTFSEEIDISTATFQVDQGIGNPSNTQLSSDGLKVTLTFTNNFEQGKIYTVDALGVKDLAGNPLSNTQKQIGIIETAAKGDLLINEILFDNPDFAPEYIEVFNNSNKIIDLNRVFFGVRNTAGKLAAANYFPSNSILLPQGYLAVTTDPEQVKTGYAVPENANIMKVDRWATLNNTAANLLIGSIIGGDTLVLDEVRYEAKWHDPLLSNTKGVSLERVFPDKPSQYPANWHSAAAEVNFGTPGYQNSAFKKYPDTIPPILLTLRIVEPNQLVLTFSEPIDMMDATFSVDKGIGSPTATVLSPDKMTLTLTFSENFLPRTVYSVEADNVKDFSENVMQATSRRIGITEPIAKGDLLINEILFDNPDFAPEYIEVYNSSDKFLDMSRVFFATRNSAGKFSTNNFFPANSIIWNHGYLAVTTDPNSVRTGYHAPDTANILQVDRWSALSNSGAPLLIGTIMGADTIILDEVTYDAKWHHSLIRNAKGVSLEKINPLMPSQSASSWHSAASDVHYGTPGYKNSQFRELPTEPITEEKWFSPDPEAFTPDNDGRDDVCFIRYKTEAEGYTANVMIFNAVGVKVTQLASNQILGSEGYLVWDGKTDRGINVNPGIYVLYVELVNASSGVKKTEKMPIVVSAR